MGTESPSFRLLGNVTARWKTGSFLAGAFAVYLMQILHSDLTSGYLLILCIIPLAACLTFRLEGVTAAVGFNLGMHSAVFSIVITRCFTKAEGFANALANSIGYLEILLVLGAASSAFSFLFTLLFRMCIAGVWQRINRIRTNGSDNEK